MEYAHHAPARDVRARFRIRQASSSRCASARRLGQGTVVRAVPFVFSGDRFAMGLHATQAESIG